MKRRAYLGGVLAAVGLAGCSEGEQAAENRNQAYAEQLAESLDERSEMAVENWELTDDRLYLYVQVLADRQRVFRLIAGAYAGNVNNGLDRPLTATGRDVQDETVLYFHIDPEPAQGYMDDELSEDEYLNRVEIEVPSS